MRRGRRAALAACLVLAIAAAPGAALAQTVDELYASGVKARQAQHFDEAADLLQRALALKPDNTDALVQLGFAELGRNDLPAAQNAFSRALSLAPAYGDASFGMAEVEFRSGNLDAALALAEKVSRPIPAMRMPPRLSTTSTRRSRPARRSKLPRRWRRSRPTGGPIPSPA